jgi:ATP citrate (pro-S)-lyase
VQFGHAGARAASPAETAIEKNRALRDAGAIVPDSYDELGDVIHYVYKDLVKNGQLPQIDTPEPVHFPLDFKEAQKKGLVRKPASIVSTISDDRGEELTYHGVAISKVVEENYGIGGTIGLLWFKKKLPALANEFLEMLMVIVADHGPAVSGAHNAIVAARAGKDLVSSVASGLLTIGPRFGGAIDGAARDFKEACDRGATPEEFVMLMKKEGRLILGIGHRVKSVQNPDKRVELIKSYALQHFGECKYLKYALEVEKITTMKKNNLILNVDGAVAVSFIDMLYATEKLETEEIEHIVELGFLNGLFVIGRCIGIVGHILDQKRLTQSLYRHPWEDITYVAPEEE